MRFQKMMLWLFSCFWIARWDCVAFQVPQTQYTRYSKTSTVLFAHRFNGGYDPSRAVSWNPMEAAEFIIWHVAEPKDAGMQLSPMIQQWNGADVGEFLTRLYLGEADPDEFKVSFESRNVRNPQWNGLDEEGLEALETLLKAALPKEALKPAEISRCADKFLLREHTWPSPEGSKDLEKDSFARQGHSTGIAHILGNLRKEHFGGFSVHDIIDMVTLPEIDDNSKGALQLREFFEALGIQMTASEKVTTVQALAQTGWKPPGIARFVGSIEEVEEPLVMVEVEEEVAAAEAQVQENEEEEKEAGGPEGNDYAQQVQQYWKQVDSSIAKVPSNISNSANGTPLHAKG